MQSSTARATRPPALEQLLEQFAAETGYVPPQARLMEDISELPLTLELRAGECGPDAAWRAWTHEGCVWFVIGRVSHWSVCHPDHLILHALFFDVSGELVSSGVWRRDQPGVWTLRLG